LGTNKLDATQFIIAFSINMADTPKFQTGVPFGMCVAKSHCVSASVSYIVAGMSLYINPTFVGLTRRSIQTCV